MPTHLLLPAARPAPSSGPAENPPSPPPTPRGPLSCLHACLPWGRPRLARTAGHGTPPRQPLPVAPEPQPTRFHDIPPEVLFSVLRRLGEPGSDAPVTDARLLATLKWSEVSRDWRKAANAILNQNTEMCYVTSVQRMKHAARQPGPWAARFAAAVRGLDHVHVQLHDMGPERLDDALSMLRKHAPLRGLAITRGLNWCLPDERALTEILHVHKGSLKDLHLVLPLHFSPELTGALAGLGGLQSLRLANMSAPLAEATSARRLADSLGALVNLRSLAVTGFSDAAALTACLPRLPHLESLRISNCRAGLQDWRVIAGNLRGLQATGMARLRQLELSAADVNDADLVPLVPVLSGMHGLHELVLAGNEIGPAGMAMLAGSLQGMGELKTLDLSGNSLHGGGITPLAGALEKLPQLEALHLLGASLAAADIGRLGAALRSAPRLQSLALSFNRLSGCSAADWLALLGAAGLESLRLNGCAMDSADMVPLAAALKACPTLKTLNLTGNDAQMPEDARALAAGLAGLPHLETCHLPTLGEEGLRVLLPALQPLQGRSLRTLIPAPVDAAIAAELRAMPPGVGGD